MIDRMIDDSQRPMVAFRDVILDYLRKVQRGMCADCGRPVDRTYQEKVIYKRRDSPDDTLDNLKLVHQDCSKATRIVEDRVDRARALLNDGMSVRQAAIILNVSERTIQRYVRRLRKAQKK